MTLRNTIQNRKWNTRAAGWDHAAIPGLEKVAATVLDRAAPLTGLRVLDLGSGSGQLTLDAASSAKAVVAVDLSQRMLTLLEERAAQHGHANVETVLGPLQSLDLPDGTVDVIVTNYSLHHLRHHEKAALLRRSARWLRPGGRIVIGDMMFALAGDPAGRRILTDKLADVARRGPAGWWRIAKNGWRMVLRQECPESIATWTSLLEAAGFAGIQAERVVAEAAVVTAFLPGR